MTENLRRSRISGSAAVIVLGMHRSGTSALAGVLARLGVEMGKRLVAPSSDNPRGYWENREILTVHQRLLTDLGRTWDDPRPLPDGWPRGRAAQTAAAELRRVLHREFGGHKLWGVKDPRLCRLLPLWQPVLRELSVVPRYLFIVRDPEEVSRSLAARDRIALAEARLLWLVHMLDAERTTRGERRHFLRYADLLDTLPGVARRAGEIEAALNLSWPRPWPVAESDIAAFLSSELRRQRRETHADRAADWIDGVADALMQGESAALHRVCDAASDRFAALVPGLPPRPAVVPRGRRNWVARRRDGLRRWLDR